MFAAAILWKNSVSAAFCRPLRKNNFLTEYTRPRNESASPGIGGEVNAGAAAGDDDIGGMVGAVVAGEDEALGAVMEGDASGVVVVGVGVVDEMVGAVVDGEDEVVGEGVVVFCCEEKACEGGTFGFGWAADGACCCDVFVRARPFVCSPPSIISFLGTLVDLNIGVIIGV